MYVYSFAYFERINSANELPRVYLTMAMVDRASLDIGPELARLQRSIDTSTFKGKLYSNKPPGLSIASIPVYIVYKAANGWNTIRTLGDLRVAMLAFRIVGVTLPSLLFLFLLSRFLARLVDKRSIRRLLVLAYALGTMALTYGTLFVSHQFGALCIGTAVILVISVRRGWRPARDLYAAGFIAGFGVLVEYQLAFAGPLIAIYGLRCVKPRLRAALQFGLPALVPIAVLLLYHWVCFDSPLKTGYDYPTSSYFKEMHSHGLLGLSTFSPTQFAARHFSANDGLFYYSPFLLLAFPGLVLMIRERAWRAEGLLCASLIGFFIYFMSSLTLVSGWDIGPRYVTCALPYYMFAIAFILRKQRHRFIVGLAAGLIAVSIVIYASCNAVFPHYPDKYTDPWFDITLRFGLAGYLPYNVGWALGLSGLASSVPYVALVCGLLGWTVWRLRRGWDRFIVCMMAIAVTVTVLCGYAALLDRAKRFIPPRGDIAWIHRIWEPKSSEHNIERLMKHFAVRKR